MLIIYASIYATFKGCCEDNYQVTIEYSEIDQSAVIEAIS